MAGFSGKDGKVQKDAADVAEVTGWTLNPTSNNPSWASSDTAGNKDRVQGVKDSTGTVTAKYDLAAGRPITDGDSVVLNLYLDATRWIIVYAIVDSVSFEVDINDGETITFSFDFSQRYDRVANASIDYTNAAAA